MRMAFECPAAAFDAVPPWHSQVLMGMERWSLQAGHMAFQAFPRAGCATFSPDAAANLQAELQMLVCRLTLSLTVHSGLDSTSKCC